MRDKLKIAVFASGRGSNFLAILNGIHAGKIHNAKIVLMICNNAGAQALVTARNNNIPTLYLDRKAFRSDEEFSRSIIDALESHGANFIALAGYMKKLDSHIITSFKNRIVNIHPALLPAFGGKGMHGMNVHKAVLASMSATSGATVHIVDEEYDNGPVVLQQSVSVASDDTPETLAAKVLAIEHELYPEAIRLFAEGRVQVNRRQVTIIN